MRPRLRRLLGLLLLAVPALSACGGNGAAASPETLAPPARTPVLLHVAPAFPLAAAPMSPAALAALPTPPNVAGAGPLGRYQTPGVLYGVWDPRRGSALRAFGLANRRTGAPMRTGQSFRIGSVTKTFTATAVLLLVDDRRVDLDAPARLYVGSLIDALPGGEQVTVRELLNMTSGFADYGGAGDGPFATAVLAPHRVWTPTQVVQAATRYASNDRGTFAYSNTNYALLGVLIRRVSGMSYGAFVRRRILRPLGLRHTRIPSPAVTPPVATHGYLNATWPSFFPPPPRAVRAAGAAGEDATDWSTSAAGATANGVSTLGDLARWAAADFGNVLLSPRTRAARLATVPAGSLLKRSAYGLGLQVERGWHFHVGEIFGWETLAMGNPRTHQVVVVVRNACCGSGFENYLTARAAMPSLAPVVDPVYGRR
jgi:D-alanyl-D-alanine carboxypeptidase